MRTKEQVHRTVAKMLGRDMAGTTLKVVGTRSFVLDLPHYLQDSAGRRRLLIDAEEIQLHQVDPIILKVRICVQLDVAHITCKAAMHAARHISLAIDLHLRIFCSKISTAFTERQRIAQGSNNPHGPSPASSCM